MDVFLADSLGPNFGGAAAFRKSVQWFSVRKRRQLNYEMAPETICV
jgi:hypothetical protein